MTPIKRGTARRLSLHAPTKARRGAAQRRGRVDFTAIPPGALIHSCPPQPPAIRYVPVPYNGGMPA